MSWIPPSTITSAKAIIALCVVMLVVGSLAVGLRFYGRKSLKVPIRSDDWAMLSAYIFFLVMMVVAFIGVGNKTIGYPSAIVLKSGTPARTSKIVILCLTISTTLTLGLIKLSALLFFRRVLCVFDRRTPFQTAVEIFMFIVVGWIVTYFVFPFTICGDHFSAQWTSDKEWEMYCKLGLKNFLTASITDLILDVFIVLLPVQKIWSLQMTVQRRIAVTFVFLTACISLAASAARMAIVGKGTKVPASDGGLVDSGIFFTWILEAGFGMLAVNLPSLWYLRTKIAPEKVLRSVQSIISLRSRQSKSSSDSLPTQEAGQKDSRRRSSSKASHASTKFEAGREDIPEMPNKEHAIHVHTDLKQEVKSV